MTGGQGSTERHYRRLLDKLKSRSNRIFVKAQMQNRTQDQRLKKVVGTLERDRDLRIRKAHEGIWRVASKDCPAPRLARPEGLPSYLGRPKATTLPTPAELASLLPRKKPAVHPAAAARPQSAAAAAAADPSGRPPPRQYTKMSKRRLSEMTTDQLQIWHYRQSLVDREGATEAPGEGDGEEAAKTSGQGEGRAPPPAEAEKAEDSTAAAEESIRIVMRKLGIRPQSSPLSYSQSGKGGRPKKKRPHTSTGYCPDAIAEQKVNSSSKVLKTNYLEMYQSQMKSHVRRMSSRGTAPAATGAGARADSPARQELDSSQGLDRTTSTRASSTTPSRFASPSFSLEARGIASPLKQQQQQTPRASTLMRPTTSSSSHASPRRRMRRLSQQVRHAGAFEQLRQEVQRVQSYKSFRRESLGVTDTAGGGGSGADDPEQEEELFDEMRRCRYIRWGKEDETIIEELEEEEPLQLQNQLALLTLKYTPSKKKERKTGWSETSTALNSTK